MRASRLIIIVSVHSDWVLAFQLGVLRWLSQGSTIGLHRVIHHVEMR